jgi:solute carrier family 8 (sodium/calcium exchanger)
LFSIIPPIKWGGGKYAFIVALTLIGMITGIVGEVAELIGCVLGMPSQITAITLVAVGTSLPDTFASVTAARSS